LIQVKWAPQKRKPSGAFKQFDSMDRMAPLAPLIQFAQVNLSSQKDSQAAVPIPDFTPASGLATDAILFKA
jgi:hypothetical protein